MSATLHPSIVTIADNFFWRLARTASASASIASTLLAIILPLCADAGVLTGPVLNVGNGHEYYLLAANTWTGSELEAISLGGHLATVRNQTENDWLLTTFGSVALNAGGGLWIGFYDPVQNDGSGVQHAANFIWSSGEPITYTNWGQGEPNNSPYHGGERYGMILATTYEVLLPGDWNDQNNTSSGSIDYGIVEVVPEPSTWAMLTAGTGFLVSTCINMERNKDGKHAQACD